MLRAMASTWSIGLSVVDSIVRYYDIACQSTIEMENYGFQKYLMTEYGGYGGYGVFR